MYFMENGRWNKMNIVSLHRNEGKKKTVSGIEYIVKEGKDGRKENKFYFEFMI